MRELIKPTKYSKIGAVVITIAAILIFIPSKARIIKR